MFSLIFNRLKPCQRILMKIVDRKYFFPFLIVALFFLQFFFISPFGEFALNDDWVYAEAVKNWTETGNFRLMPYAGPTFYVPIAVGTFFSKIFGFSFSLLRVSTLAFTLTLLISLYSLLNKITKNTKLSFLGVLLLWFNPITYNLSFTFMTDIPALSLLVLSMYFYYKAFENHKPIWLFVGSVFAILGFYTRQTSILILCAAGLFAIINFKKFKFKNLLWSFGIPILTAIFIYFYLSINNLLPQSAGDHIVNNTQFIFQNTKSWLWYIFMYLGLFLLPITIGWLTKYKSTFLTKQNPKRNALLILSAVILTTSAILKLIWNIQFPYIGNMITVYGLGPLNFVLAGEAVQLFSNTAQVIITLLATISFCLLLFIIFPKKLNTEPTGFIYLFGILYTLSILLFVSFDRYLLPLIIVATILLFQKIKHTKFSYTTAFFLIAMFAVFSISQTHHYISINKVRWNMANQLLEKSILPNQIDAGYEWNGWYAYWENLASPGRLEPTPAPWWIQNLFFENTQDYKISLTPIQDYTILEEKTIKAWNPNNKLYLLKKQTNQY